MFPQEAKDLREGMVAKLVHLIAWVFGISLIAVIPVALNAQDEQAPAVESAPADPAPPPPPPPTAEPAEEPPPPPPVEDTPPPPPPEMPADSGPERSDVKSSPSKSGGTGMRPAPKDSAGKKDDNNKGTGDGSDIKGADAVPAGQELVNLDFPEMTEIKDIIKAVALWTGKNVLLDRNANGKVQIISPRKVTKEEAYQAFLSALNMIGLTTVETGKIIKILPIRTAVKGNLKTFMGSQWTPMTDEIITQIVPLKYIDADEISKTLSRIVNSNSMIAYKPTNTLIISDSGYKVKHLLDILSLLDVKGQQPQLAIVPIKFADAKDIAEKVNEIFKTSQAAKGQSSSGGVSAYKIMMDERSNSVIIFGPPRTIDDIKSLVKKFDIPLEDPSRQSTIHVRPLDYADAKKLSATLTSLATAGKAGSSTFRRPPISTPTGSSGPNASGGAPSVAELSDDVKITADESANALLITGSRAAYQAVNAIIRKLDIRRSQVFVETDILDMQTDNGFKFGSSIFAGTKGSKNSNVATTWEAGNMGPLIVAGATKQQNQTLTAEAAKVFADQMTIGILAGDKVNVPGIGEISPGALIKLIKTDENNRALSSPHILTANNEEAEIAIGNMIFFQSAELNAQTGTAVPKLDKEKVELSLKIKPNVSHANYVTMKVDITANSFAGIEAATKQPKISTRKTSQIVTVKNAQTVVISGLVTTSETESYRKIPLLGDIPILGWLFRNSDIRSIKSNLVVFLTPHIVHGADDLAAIYKRKIEERDEFMRVLYGSSFKEDSFYAQLPDEKAGEYKADEGDEQEKRRREAMLRELQEELQEDGSTGMTSPETTRNLEKPVPVPAPPSQPSSDIVIRAEPNATQPKRENSQPMDNVPPEEQ